MGTHVKQYRNVQGLRAVAVLLVVLEHLHDFSDKFHIEPTLIKSLDPLPAWGVDLFFVISGFVMIVVHWKDFGRPGSPKRFLLKRIIRIFPLYWTVTFLVLLALRFTPGLTHTWMGASANIPLSLLLLPQDGGEVLFVAWTLTYEMYFYYVFAITLIFPRSFAWRTFAVWSIIILVMQFVPMVQQNTYGSVLCGNLVLEFIMGAIVGALTVRRRFVSPFWPIAFGCLALPITLLGIHAKLIADTGAHFITVGLPMAAIVYGAVVLEVRHRKIFPVVLQSIGDASYSTYLWHPLLFSMLGKILLGSRIVEAIPTPVFLTLTPMLVVCASLLLYYYLEVPLTKFSRRLIAPALSSNASTPALANETA